MVSFAHVATLVALFVALLEAMHARRIGRVAFLAFGPGGRPAFWTRAVPFLRSLAGGAACLGLLILYSLEPRSVEERPERAASRHLLLALDVSPSMLIKDAGPDREKLSRAVWAGRVVQGILDRLDMETTRVTVVAFYTDALPVIRETFDKEVVSNILDGLPMYTAFEPGATKLQEGVSKALDLARTWPPESATLVVVSDGDALGAPPPARIPTSLADTLVIGVGDPFKSTIVGGHGSRQDTAALKQLAARLGGVYHEGNEKHLPTEIVNNLTMIQPRATAGMTIRAIGLALTGLGAGILALLGPALTMLGSPSAFRSERRRAKQLAKERLAPDAEASPGVTT